MKSAFKYFDIQLKKLFLDLTRPDNIKNFKSNQKTWEKDDEGRDKLVEIPRKEFEVDDVLEKDEDPFNEDTPVEPIILIIDKRKDGLHQEHITYVSVFLTMMYTSATYVSNIKIVLLKKFIKRLALLELIMSL
jgi:hypothetical protein